MKNFILLHLLAMVVASSTSCVTPEKQRNESISIKDLNERPIIGELGVPLGDIAKIKATVIDGDSLDGKEYGGQLLLKVNSVNGKELKNGPTMPFATVTGMPYESLEDDWVGKSVSLEVYEAGEFWGLPRDMPDDWPLWQASSYRFRSHLNISSWPGE